MIGLLERLVGEFDRFFTNRGAIAGGHAQGIGETANDRMEGAAAERHAAHRLRANERILRGGEQTRFGPKRGDVGEDRGILCQRLAVDHQQRHFAQRIYRLVGGTVLLAGCEIDQFEPVGQPSGLERANRDLRACVGEMVERQLGLGFVHDRAVSYLLPLNSKLRGGYRYLDRIRRRPLGNAN